MVMMYYYVASCIVFHKNLYRRVHLGSQLLCHPFLFLGHGSMHLFVEVSIYPPLKIKIDLYLFVDLLTYVINVGYVIYL